MTNIEGLQRVADEVADVPKNGRDRIAELASKHMAAVSTEVRSSLDALQAAIDETRALLDSSEAQARMAIENHMTVAASSLELAGAMQKRIAELRDLVKQTMPNTAAN